MFHEFVFVSGTARSQFFLKKNVRTTFGAPGYMCTMGLHHFQIFVLCATWDTFYVCCGPRKHARAIWDTFYVYVCCGPQKQCTCLQSGVEDALSLLDGLELCDAGTGAFEGAVAGAGALQGGPPGELAQRLGRQGPRHAAAPAPRYGGRRRRREARHRHRGHRSCNENSNTGKYCSQPAIQISLGL